MTKEMQNIYPMLVRLLAYRKNIAAVSAINFEGPLWD
jgi:hypothetical protein